jgi:hypothetical protein
VPWLWRFHAIHHSSTDIDWLAGSRLHLVDVVITRGFTFVPIALLGFASSPVYAYLVFVSFHAVFIHANVRFGFGRIEHLIVTPRFHHWHHSAEDNARDKNFAVHLLVRPPPSRPEFSGGRSSASPTEEPCREEDWNTHPSSPACPQAFERSLSSRLHHPDDLLRRDRFPRR